MSHPIRWHLIFAVLLMVNEAFGAELEHFPRLDGPPLPLPKGESGTSRQVHAIAKDMNALDPLVGGYMPAYHSAKERQTIYARWSRLLMEARDAHSAYRSDAETLLVLTAHLLRQGHNMNVEGAGELADKTITQCLDRFPQSVGCHREAIAFYLQTDPSATGVKAEPSLMFLRQYYGPAPNEDVERGFVYFYLYQGRTVQAVQQIDHYLAQFPQSAENDMFARLRAQLVSRGMDAVHQ
jgi:hypothetical protein